MLCKMGKSRVPSLRWRLLGLVSVVALLVVGLAAALSYRQARHEVQELMDDQMSKLAQLMLAEAHEGVEHLSNLPELLAAQRGLHHRHNGLTFEYQVGTQDGTVIARSPEVPVGAFSGVLGFSTVMHENQHWRNLILETTDGNYRVQLAQSVPKRDREALEIARKTVLPLGVVFPLLLVAIYFSVRRGLRPLDDLAADVMRRSPENLTPLADTEAPREVQPLVAAINRLLFRLAGSLECERRFTADAAHELRTPLAAARIQAQVAMLSDNSEKRAHALMQTIAGIDRSTRLVEQMLRLARLDPLAQLSDPARVELAELMGDVIAGVLDASPGRLVATEMDEELAQVDGDAGLLAVALRNLIDNALKYAGAESRISVFLRREQGGVLMGVCDDGPGVAPEEMPKLIERFYRGSSANEEGSGLGLTIVHRVAELHGAKLELTNRESGGFQAALRWPAVLG